LANLRGADEDLVRDRLTQFSRINGLSPRAHEAIAILEAGRLGEGAVAKALDAYADFLAQPGRWLYLPDSCSCSCDLPMARDIP
jgi:hypothetical protein